jgi:hypothetical protein
MLTHPPQPLPCDLNMPCYACEHVPATHVCRFKVGELTIQVCLCEECMKIDTTRLLKNTIGIQGIAEKPEANYLIQSSSIALQKS